MIKQSTKYWICHIELLGRERPLLFCEDNREDCERWLKTFGESMSLMVESVSIIEVLGWHAHYQRIDTGLLARRLQDEARKKGGADETSPAR